MKKIFLFAPAFLLFACGGEEAVDHVDEAVETAVETVEEIMPEPVTYISGLSNEEEILAFLDAKSWENEEPHASGMHIVIDEPGEGDARPVLTDAVTIFYAGYLLDGKKFDGTAEMPANFPLMNLIQGWQIGIPMFGKGGRGKLIIPADLAYGDRDNGEIPGGSTLLFEIELMDWNAAN